MSRVHWMAEVEHAKCSLITKRTCLMHTGGKHRFCRKKKKKTQDGWGKMTPLQWAVGDLPQRRKDNLLFHAPLFLPAATLLLDVYCEGCNSHCGTRGNFTDHIDAHQRCTASQRKLANWLFRILLIWLSGNFKLITCLLHWISSWISPVLLPLPYLHKCRKIARF